MDKKCILIDHDSKNIEILKTLLEKSGKFIILSSFDNFKDSKDFLSSISVDIIFIGFTLPVFNPFNFLDSLNSNPFIVFISDQTGHAFKSFDYNTLDYIKTPLNEALVQDKKFLFPAPYPETGF